MHNAVDFLATPSKIDSTRNGKYAKINDTHYSQCIIIGKPSPINPMTPGIPKHLNQS